MVYPAIMAPTRRYASILIMTLLFPTVIAQQFPLAQGDPVILAALEYIAAHQTVDGGFGQLGESDLSTTSRACEAITASGGDPLSYRVNGVGPDDYYLSISEAVFNGSYGTNPIAEKINLILGLAACSLNPREFGGHDFVADLLSLQNQTTHSFGSGPSDTAYALLALMASGVKVETPSLQEARNFLEASQLVDGTFEYSPGWGADSNTHSIIIITLMKMGSCHGCFNDAVRAIPTFINGTNRGFYYQSMWGQNSDVSSTALGIQSILAAVKDPLEPPYASGSENAVNYLMGMQNSTTGEFYDPWGSLRPTTLAVPALLGILTPGVNISELPLLSLLAICVMFGYKRCVE
jgi:hypothetical protein